MEDLSRGQTEQMLVFSLVVGYLTSKQNGDKSENEEMTDLLYYASISGYDDLIQKAQGKIFVSDLILKKAMKVIATLEGNSDVDFDAAIAEGKKLLE